MQYVIDSCFYYIRIGSFFLLYYTFIVIVVVVVKRPRRNYFFYIILSYFIECNTIINVIMNLQYVRLLYLVIL